MNKDLIKHLMEDIGLLSDRNFNLGFLDTGSYALNKVISGKYSGGWPIGGICEVWGESSTGKTIFLTHALKDAQSKGYITAFFDNEFTYNAEFAKLMGLDPKQLLYDDPPSVPDCFDRIENLIKKVREKDKDTPLIMCLDSMAGQSGEEAEKGTDSYSNMSGAIRAKEIGMRLRHVNPLLRKNNALLLLVNQVRSKPNVMYGSPITKSGGGKSLEFYCTVSIQVASNKTSDVIENKDKRAIGIKGRLKNTKNKCSTPFQECEFELIWDNGLNRFYGLEQAVIDAGLIEKAGAWYTIKSTGKKFQGEDNLQEFILNDPGVLTYLKEN